MKGFEQVCHELRRHGVSDVFGLAGDGNYRYLSQLPAFGIAYHGARHETAAIGMADGYARSTGRIGVCTVTHGPGLTHAVSALVEVRKSQSPVVLLASDTPTWPTAYSCQDVDQAAVLQAIGFRAERVRSVGTLARDVARVLAFARHEREPIALLIPTDVQDDDCVYAPTDISPRLAASPPDATDVARLTELLQESRRPLLLAGRGARDKATASALVALADDADMLLGNTALALGAFTDDPYAVGVVGGFASPGIRAMISEADLIVAFAASFSTWTTLAGRLIAPTAQLVQVDRDPTAIGAHAPVSLGIVADAKATAEAVSAAVRARGRRAPSQRVRDVAERIAEAAQLPFVDAGTDDRVDPRSVVAWLDEAVPRERTICLDGGWHGKLPVQRLVCPDPEGFVFSQTYQSIGLGIGTAIGASIGRPERLTVLIMGDGGLSMTSTELVTAVHSGHPLLVVVINDSAYLAEVEGLGWLDLPTEVAQLATIDFAAVARAVGGAGMTVRRIADLQPLRDWLAAPTGLMLVDCRIPFPMDYGGGGAEDWIEHIWDAPSGAPAR